MANRLMIVLGIFIALAVLAYPQSQVQDTLESGFASGGVIHLRLSYGDYLIQAGRDDRVVAYWKDNHGVDIRDRAMLTVAATTATIRTDGAIRHGHFIVEVPSRSDIFLRLKAGDLQISGIEGNKDIHMTAGDLSIDVNPASYSKVHGSVTFGDIDAHALRISKGGIHRSFDWRGGGAYELRASIMMGDLKIR
jgi:hypothetical protein